MNANRKTDILKRKISDLEERASFFREETERLIFENGNLKRRLEAYEEERTLLLELKEEYEKSLDELLDIKYKYQAVRKELSDIKHENKKSFNALMKSLKKTVKKEKK